LELTGIDRELAERTIKGMERHRQEKDREG
jgi:hypothetical protein